LEAELEGLCCHLGLTAEGTLDGLRKQVKDKWTAVEPFLPPHVAAKSSQNLKPVQSNGDSREFQPPHLIKAKTKIVSDMIAAVPLLAKTDPESVLKFLIAVTQVVQLKLIPDSEFIALLMSRTSGRAMQILGTHLGLSNDWGMVQTEIVSTFLPPRVKERFLASFVLNRFQNKGEDLTDYVTSVVEAAKILGFAGSESQLVGRMVQNLHPSVKSHLIFETRPE
jgi:hypothetical protein